MVCKIKRPVAGNRAQTAVYCKGKYEYGAGRRKENGMNTLGQRIAYYRKAANLTQAELLHVVSADGEEVSITL